MDYIMYYNGDMFSL